MSIMWHLVGSEKITLFLLAPEQCHFLLGDVMRRCTRCKKEKPLGEFYQFKSKKNKRHYQSWCKECGKKYQKQYYQANKEERRRYKKQWYQVNKEYQKEYRRKHWAKHPWAKHLNGIIARCTTKDNGYHQRGIKNFLIMADVKHLWFRDKAYNLKQPSIDRIDTYGNYTLDNCRFIELTENQKRPKARK